MGNVNQQKKSELSFIQRLQDRAFGPIDIYQNTEGVYLMQVQRNFSKDDVNHKTIRQITQYALASKHNFIIPIVSIKTDDHHGFCGIFSTFTLITEYYNFTLHDMIKNKKVFDQGQLWLIFQALLTLILDLKNNNLSMKLEGGRVFLTLKGKPAISHLHIQSDRNSLTFHFSTMGQQLARLLIQLILGKLISQEYLEESDAEMIKCLEQVQHKYKRMFVFIKALLYQEKKQKDVYIQLNELFSSGKAKKANQIKLTKFKYLIPEKIAHRQQKEVKKDRDSNKDSTISKITNVQFVTSVNDDNLLQNSIKQRKRTQYDDKSETNKQYHSSSEFFLNDKTNQISIASNKLESSKLLGQFERKKQQYRLQKQKFELKRNELLSQSEKQNVQFSRPSMRDYESKKNKNKTKNQQVKRISTEVSKNSRCR